MNPMIGPPPMMSGMGMMPPGMSGMPSPMGATMPPPPGPGTVPPMMPSPMQAGGVPAMMDPSVGGGPGSLLSMLQQPPQMSPAGIDPTVLMSIIQSLSGGGLTKAPETSMF